jgi:hypothetical protein
MKKLFLSLFLTFLVINTVFGQSTVRRAFTVDDVEAMYPWADVFIGSGSLDYDSWNRALSTPLSDEGAFRALWSYVTLHADAGRIIYAPSTNRFDFNYYVSICSLIADVPKASMADRVVTNGAALVPIEKPSHVEFIYIKVR